MSGSIQIEREDDIMVVINNNPSARNALSIEFYTGFAETVSSAAIDPTIGAIVLTGAGDFFCSGGDLNRLKSNAERSPEERRAGVERLHQMILAMRSCPKPIIAAIEGGAAGAGVSLAMACDMIVSSPQAYFSAAYVRVGLTPDGGATSFLGNTLPRQLATELCLTGERIGAVRLYNLGVINQLVEAGTVLEAAKSIARRLSHGPARATARIKALCEAASINTLQKQLNMEADFMVQSQSDPEAIEGIGAFLDKRKPDFASLRRAKVNDGSED
jgi:enoyl-CoA hydratase/carnithine racemase